ncbi:MAG: SufD family Fe-S cluster assembly protein [Bacilli bacterium]|jgi:Fe-S cluster assembly scaffold protein SufB
MSQNKRSPLAERSEIQTTIDLSSIPFDNKKLHRHESSEGKIDNISIIGNIPSLFTFKIDRDALVNVTHVSLEKFADLKLQFLIAERAKVNFAMADFGQGKGKIKIFFHLQGQEAEANFRLSSLTSQKDRKTYEISFVHEAPHTHSKMENYGVVYQEGELRFAGVSHIQEIAANSEAHQFARIMLFDEKSIGKVEPVLKIDHDAVTASHAATVGKANDEHLYYLCSRGLSLREAKNLITAGYLKPIIASFSDVGTREQIYRKIEEQEVGRDE